MEVETHSKPDLKPIARSRLHKTCGPLQRYASRTVELMPDGWLYVFLDGMAAPQSKILVAGATITDNKDAPNGFTLLSTCRSKKHKFVCQDVDTKRVWVGYLHTVANQPVPGGADAFSPNLGVTSPRGPRVSARYVQIDRTGEPLVEGSLLKRSGMASYAVRWCEVWQGVGLAYAKFKTAADDQFKVVPLDGARIVINDDKVRITIHPKNGDDPTYLRFDGHNVMTRWADVLRRESGYAGEWEDLSATVGETSVLNPADLLKMRREANEPELDSDDELELADLESETPVRPHKIAAEFDSVSRTVNADVDTPGFDAVLDERMSAMGSYGFMRLLDQFEQRMSVPMFGPFATIHKHISTLDVDAQSIRKFLCELLDAFPREVKVVIVAQRADALLTQYKMVRDILLVRRDIAEFRELKGRSALPLGVNASLAAVANQTRALAPDAASVGDIEKARKLADALRKTLHEFRVDFDVFDDAYYTITEMEKGIADAENWANAAERCVRERAL